MLKRTNSQIECTYLFSRISLGTTVRLDCATEGSMVYLRSTTSKASLCVLRYLEVWNSAHGGQEEKLRERPAGEIKHKGVDRV